MEMSHWVNKTKTQVLFCFHQHSTWNKTNKKKNKKKPLPLFLIPVQWSSPCPVLQEVSWIKRINNTFKKNVGIWNAWNFISKTLHCSPLTEAIETLGNHVTETITKKRSFLLGAALGHGEACFVCLQFILCINSFFGVWPLRSHQDNTYLQWLCRWLKLLHNIWFSLISRINLFIFLAQFHCYMPGFSVADDQYRLNHFWIFTLKQKWIYFITSIYLLQHIFWSHPFFKVVISVRTLATVRLIYIF